MTITITLKRLLLPRSQNSFVCLFLFSSARYW